MSPELLRDLVRVFATEASRTVDIAEYARLHEIADALARRARDARAASYVETFPEE